MLRAQVRGNVTRRPSANSASRSSASITAQRSRRRRSRAGIRSGSPGSTVPRSRTISRIVRRQKLERVRDFAGRDRDRGLACGVCPAQLVGLAVVATRPCRRDALAPCPSAREKQRGSPSSRCRYSAPGPLAGLPSSSSAPRLLELVPVAGVFPHPHQVRGGDALVAPAADAPRRGERVARPLGGARQVEPPQEVTAVELGDDQPVGQLVLPAQLDCAVEQDARLVDAPDARRTAVP